ncbi:MAG: sugar phosphate isomerase/epimerase [Nitrososphaerota archaeon]|nr:sugar phosphate isomerase/epimerase [Nitrososphaerota archaeon]
MARPDQRGREKALRLHEEYLRLSESLGAKYYVIHPGIDVYLDQVGGRWDDAKKVIKFERNEGELARLWRINAESLAFLGDFASKLKVKIALETGPTNLITISETLKIIEGAGRDNIGVCVDAGHVNVGGVVRPEDAIREAGELLWALHLHDNNGEGDSHLPPGEGSMDWPRVVRALEDVSYRGTYNVELAYLDWKTDGAWKKAKESVSFLTAVLG